MNQKPNETLSLQINKPNPRDLGYSLTICTGNNLPDDPDVASYEKDWCVH